MRDDWIKEDIAKINELFLKAADDNLMRSFCMYSLRMLNSAAQIMNTDFFYFTENAILPILKMYIKYFIEETQEYLEQDFDMRKSELLDDLEKAVVIMTDFYKDITASSNFADKTLLQTILLNVDIYSYQIKQCSFFTEGLNWLIDLIQQGDETLQEEEAYIVGIHPTANKEARAEVLFESRKNSGKVIILQVPEHKFFDFSSLFNSLVHRVFFVLSKKYRQRTLRAENFHKIIMQYMTIELLENGESEWDSKLLEFWMKDFQDKIQKTLLEDKNEKKYYFKALKTFYANELNGKMKEILMNRDYREIIKKLLNTDEMQSNTLEKYSEKYQEINSRLKEIQDNVCNIFIEGKVRKYIEFVSYMIRDTYADLLMIMTLDLSPQQYVSTFYGIGNANKIISLEHDFPTYWRIDLVFLTIKEGNKEFRWNLKGWSILESGSYDKVTPGGWKNYVTNEINEKRNNETTQKENVKQLFPLENGLKISVYEDIVNCFLLYLKTCGNEYNSLLNKKSAEFSRFRAKYVDVFSSDVESIASTLNNVYRDS